MLRCVVVRVYDSSGKPAYNARVALFVTLAGSGGGTMERYSNQRGEAEFTLDGHDESSQVAVHVTGSERFGVGSIRGEYRAVI